jgi:REP element-mobilizing transposase RayT
LVQDLKQRVSSQLRSVGSQHDYSRSIVRRGTPQTPLPQFWQRRFYDFNVWTQQKKNEKFHYMHNNPIKRGLVTHSKDWPWSSYGFYARNGEVLLSLNVVD